MNQTRESLFEKLSNQYADGTPLAAVPRERRHVKSICDHLSRLLNTREGTLAHKALVEDVIGDVKTAIETSDRTLGGLLSHQRDIRRGPTRFLERESGDDIIAAGITYIVEFVEGWGAPA